MVTKDSLLNTRFSKIARNNQLGILRTAFMLFFAASHLFFFAGCSSQKNQDSFDIIQYDIDVNWQSSQSFHVISTISIQVNAPVQIMDWLLNRNVTINTVQIKNHAEWQDLKYTFKTDSLYLMMPHTDAHSKQDIRVDYFYSPENSIGDFYYMDRGNRWYPIILDEVARVRMTAVVPSSYQMFSCGNITQKQETADHTTFQWETTMPVFKIPFVLIRHEKYNVYTTPCDKTDIHYYSLPNNEWNDRILSEACQTFQYFQENIGSYHHNQLNLIEMNQYENMTFIATGIVLIGSGYINQFRSEQFEGLRLPIAMQWFGAGVFGKFQQDGFWFFSLSLPHYLRLMYTQSTEGEETFQKEMDKPYQKYLSLVDSTHKGDILKVNSFNTPENSYNIFGNGPFIWHQLRVRMGDTAWHPFLQKLYHDYQGKVLTADTFIHLLDELAGDDVVQSFYSLTGMSDKTDQSTVSKSKRSFNEK